MISRSLFPVSLYLNLFCLVLACVTGSRAAWLASAGLSLVQLLLALDFGPRDLREMRQFRRHMQVLRASRDGQRL